MSVSFVFSSGLNDYLLLLDTERHETGHRQRIDNRVQHSTTG